MGIGTIIALVITIPIILVPVVFIWSINIRGMIHASRRAKARQAATKLVYVSQHKQ